MGYDATTECYDVWWLSGFVLFCIALFVRMTRQSPEKRSDPSNTYYEQFVKPYKSQYWYFEFILFSRRFFIALFSSLRVYTRSNIDILLLFLMIIYLIIHVAMRPFKWQRLNIVEGICLLSLSLVIGATPQLNSDNHGFTDFFIGTIIIVPFIAVCFYVFIAIRNICDKEMKQFEKVKQRTKRITEEAETYSPVAADNEIELHNLSKDKSTAL